MDSDLEIGKTIVVAEPLSKATRTHLMHEGKYLEKTYYIGVSVAKVISLGIVLHKVFIEYLDFLL